MDKAIPERLKQARLTAGLTISEVAVMKGCTPDLVHMWEAGMRPAGGILALALARIYGVSEAWLYGEETPRGSASEAQYIAAVCTTD